MRDHILREALLSLELVSENVEGVSGSSQLLSLALGLLQPGLEVVAVVLELFELLLDALHLLHLLLGVRQRGLVATLKLLDVVLQLPLLFRGQNVGLFVQQSLSRLCGQDQVLLLGQDLLVTSLLEIIPIAMIFVFCFFKLSCFDQI